jgi:hypothetical protein
LDTAPVFWVYAFWPPVIGDNSLMRITIPQKALIYLRILVFKELISNNFRYATNFFNRMADQEAERVIKYYSQIFETNPDEGGGSEKIKTNARQVRKLCSND